ncbi:hypothetical protein QE422_001679 [Chryseobacterium sp. SORGH_AS 447]|uniref:hypothetical protein n=1 Tax=Chryseobacterium sp. SORGH_AS_0447 TaxID=3041769 RepID=UPI002781FA9F|nr:hypothetical protein [Chryseobacterium sp. SORGH_AS_0447]MDQ1161311.1 hypothetical protein [Chryseobacterium sp. SORGH_AS_0447]
MDQETVRYIINYFSHLMTEDEKLALKYQMYMYKSSDNEKQREMMIKKGWIRHTSETDHLFREGYEEFEINVARRIMKETPEKIFFNNCPRCGKLARTPSAQQCRYCGLSWYKK